MRNFLQFIASTKSSEYYTGRAKQQFRLGTRFTLSTNGISNRSVLGALCGDTRRDSDCGHSSWLCDDDCGLRPSFRLYFFIQNELRNCREMSTSTKGRRRGRTHAESSYRSQFPPQRQQLESIQ